MSKPREEWLETQLQGLWLRQQERLAIRRRRAEHCRRYRETISMLPLPHPRARTGNEAWKKLAR